MKVIAFFDLRNAAEMRDFLIWANRTQASVFEEHLPRMHNFTVLELAEADNYEGLSQVVQLFDWDGSPEEWRQTIASFQCRENGDLFGVAQKWLTLCDEGSVRILYAED